MYFLSLVYFCAVERTMTLKSCLMQCQRGMLTAIAPWSGAWSRWGIGHCHSTVMESWCQFLETAQCSNLLSIEQFFFAETGYQRKYHSLYCQFDWVSAGLCSTKITFKAKCHVKCILKCWWVLSRILLFNHGLLTKTSHSVYTGVEWCPQVFDLISAT